MSGKFYIEVACDQRNYGNERICGDVFISRKVKEENRTIVVLSDGMGHGVKANVLATLTATLAVNFTMEHKAVDKIADIIMNTLPVCSDRHMSYSTFTIVDIEHDGLAAQDLRLFGQVSLDRITKPTYGRITNARSI